MFTGLVECKGKVVGVKKIDNILELLIQPEVHWKDIEIGESIAISGACLSVVSYSCNAIIKFECMPETVSKTGFNRLKQGDWVNCERAMQAGDRFGGHMVQGHVDATATITEVVVEGRSKRMSFCSEPSLVRQLVPKGYICIDGMSLTIISIGKGRFSVALIPQTLEKTISGDYSVDDQVNIEIDITTKTIQAYLRGLNYESV